MSKIFNAAAFIFAFFMPLHGFPRLEAWGMSIRFAIFSMIPISMIFFYKLVMGEIPWKNIVDKKISFLLATFCIGVVLCLLNDATVRSLGFSVWLALSIVYFLSVIHIDYRGALWGFLGGQFFNSSYILLQNYLYPWIWVPENYGTHRAGQLRNFGFSGEPSYVAIVLIPALVYVHEKMEGWKRAALCILFIASLTLCFSGIGLISLGGFAILVLLKNRKEFVRFTLPLLLAGFLISAFQHPRFYEIPSDGVSFLAERRKVGTAKKEVEKISLEKLSSSVVQRMSHKPRLEAWVKGLHFFKDYPWGVGPGNSKRAIIKRYYPEGASENKHIDGVHNIFLEVAIEFGIWGLATFSLFLFFLLKSFFVAREWTPLMMCLGMLVPMQFAQNINMPGMWVTLAVAAGIFQMRGGR